MFETVVVEGADGTFGILDALMSTDDDEAPSPTAFLAWTKNVYTVSGVITTSFSRLIGDYGTVAAIIETVFDELRESPKEFLDLT